MISISIDKCTQHTQHKYNNKRNNLKKIAIVKGILFITEIVNQHLLFVTS